MAEAPRRTENELQKSILTEIKEFADGIGPEELMQRCEIVKEDLLRNVNLLLKMQKIKMLKQGGKPLFKIVDPGDRTVGMSQKELLVHQLIEDAGSLGIWQRELRIQVSKDIVSTELTKIMKNFMNRGIAKEVKSVMEPKKKLYMLSYITPDRSLTGGVWYNEADFDKEFVNAMSLVCADYCIARGREAKLNHPHDFLERVKASCVSEAELLEHIVKCKVSQVTLQVKDVECLMQALVFDGKVQILMAGGAVTPVKDRQGRAISAGMKIYRAVETHLPANGLTQSPCGVCPVFKFCNVGAPISPESCTYLRDWLD
ncbi:hypothetical protein SARC_00283 [Sphaeroforma arctica JP610]|uniref:DNA-directed RNA polymerase III subunit RPC6 n=1 Tax=Sphaeroforma arctica JP610 TaxID=667725 RepID=A0A0L0GFH4_9EUKA|nr:hypothetical protein SARC_00283 [Sphaeroforma arctica JP610]KNC87581.1 hypothetical protein SARC_00283 [Sphaeroforma arctica JP610]|eukprot:XP_014161483.1 hypothetical protein SARC_00283 [Sphaeroforma arctica JP610]